MDQRETLLDSLIHRESHRHHWMGLLIGLGASLLLHAVALAGCIYWMDWFGKKDGDELPHVEIIVLGNIGGSAGSIKGSPEGTNVPPEKPPIAPLLEVKAPTPTPQPIKPKLTVEDLKITVEEAQHWLSRATPQWHLPTDILQSTVKLPDLPTRELEDSWLDATAWVVEQLPKIKLPAKKEPAPKLAANVTPAPEPAPAKIQDQPIEQTQPIPKKVEEQPTQKKPEPAEKQQGNAPANGNNRSGFGSKGTGGDADGIDTPYRLPDGWWPDPNFPIEAFRQRIFGSVEFRVEYNSLGDVTHITISKSSGYPELDEPALQFAQQNWKRIIPRKIKGQPVSGAVLKRIDFVPRKST